MRSLPSRMLALPIASALVLAASGCGNTLALQSPPAADITPEPEPVLGAAAILDNSAAALDAFDAAHEAWGRREHGKVMRICAWFRDMGVNTPDCGSAQ